MSDLDVTPVDEIDSLDEVVESAPTLPAETPEYVLYGGKGGVGKTTMAAATGLSSARAGTKTLVISTDPAHSLSDTFQTPIGPEPTRIDEESPLWAVEIDPEQAMEEGTTVFAGAEAPQLEGDAMGLGSNPMEAMLGGAMPGADEAVAMQKLIEFLDDERFDRVIVDTAPTGHTLRLLRLPEFMDSMVGRVLSIREQLSGMLDGLKGMFGGDTPDEEAGMAELRELQDGIERLRAVLQDPTRTEFRIVMIPEEMSVLESRRLRDRLQEFSIPVSMIVVNRVMEPLASVADEVDPGTVLSPNIEECAFCRQRWHVQQGALQDAQDLFRDHEVRRVPLFAEEVRGERMLRIIATCLQSP